MEIRYAAAASKSFRQIDSMWRRRIRAKLNDYAVDPQSLANMVTRLVGDRRLRLRVGDYRIVFTADGVVLLVQEIGHRGEVYRRLK